MTGNKYLLDTNIIIEVFRGSKDHAEKISKLRGFYISSIVLGELYVGVNRVNNKEKYLKSLNEFLRGTTVIPIDYETSKLYGKIVASLYKKGKPIPTNDIWIAAVAVQHKLKLITNDKHFNEVQGLKLMSFK
jgi:tRNA(fMet)-specific endonuclease VapC